LTARMLGTGANGGGGGGARGGSPRFIDVGGGRWGKDEEQGCGGCPLGWPGKVEFSQAARGPRGREGAGEGGRPTRTRGPRGGGGPTGTCRHLVFEKKKRGCRSLPRHRPKPGSRTKTPRDFPLRPSLTSSLLPSLNYLPTPNLISFLVFSFLIPPFSLFFSTVLSLLPFYSPSSLAFLS